MEANGLYDEKKRWVIGRHALCIIEISFAPCITGLRAALWSICGDRCSIFGHHVNSMVLSNLKRLNYINQKSLSQNFLEHDNQPFYDLCAYVHKQPT